MRMRAKPGAGSASGMWGVSSSGTSEHLEAAAEHAHQDRASVSGAQAPVRIREGELLWFGQEYGAAGDAVRPVEPPDGSPTFAGQQRRGTPVIRGNLQIKYQKIFASATCHWLRGAPRALGRGENAWLEREGEALDHAPRPTA